MHYDSDEEFEERTEEQKKDVTRGFCTFLDALVFVSSSVQPGIELWVTLSGMGLMKIAAKHPSFSVKLAYPSFRDILSREELMTKYGEQIANSESMEIVWYT